MIVKRNLGIYVVMSKVIVSDDTRIVELQEEIAQTNIRLTSVEAKLEQVLQRLNPIQQGRLTTLEGKLDRILTHLSPIQQLRLCNLESKLDQVFRHLIRQNETFCKKIHVEESVDEEVSASGSTSKLVVESKNQSSTTKCFEHTPPIKQRSYRYDRSAINLMKYEWLNSMGSRPTSPPEVSRLDSRSSTPVDPNMTTKTQEEAAQHTTSYFGSEQGDVTSSPMSNGVLPSSTVQTKSILDKNQITHANNDQLGTGSGSPAPADKPDKNYGNIQSMSAYIRQQIDSTYLSSRDRQELRILLQFAQFESVLGSALRKDVHARLHMFSTVVTHGWSAASRITARQSAILQDMNRKMHDLHISTTNNRFKMSRFHKLAVKSTKKKKH